MKSKNIVQKAMMLKKDIDDKFSKYENSILMYQAAAVLWFLISCILMVVLSSAP